MTSAALQPLVGVTVYERSTTPVAAHAGALLARLGAVVHVDGSRRDGIELPPELAAVLDAGKSATEPVAASVDILLDDTLCQPGEHPGPAGVEARLTIMFQHAALTAIPSRPAYTSAYTATARAGVSYALGRPEDGPLGFPPGVAESSAALQAATAALAHRYGARGSDPVELTVSTVDCLEYFVELNSGMFDGYPRQWRREGRRASGSSGPYPAAIFECKDGPVGIIGRSREDWAGILAAMGDPAWSLDDEYRDPWAVAQKHADEVDAHIDRWTRAHTEAELVEASLRHSFVVAPIRTIAEVLAEPQHELRSFWDSRSDGTRLPGSPIVVRDRRAAEPADPPPPLTTDVDPRRLLAGVRVLDLSWVWAGPMTTMMMADLGAEVIKVEHPSRPDGSRMRGRPIRNGHPVGGPDLEVTPYFHQMNHGKRSLGADLTDPDAVRVIRDLAAECDVVVENMRPGVLERRGLGYEHLSAANPGLVMLSMTLAGQSGPLASMKGYAPVMGGLSGLERLVGYAPDDVTGMFTFSFADATAGVHGLHGVLAALLERERSGAGAWLDLSQTEGVISLLTQPFLDEQHGRPAVPNSDPRYFAQFSVRCVEPDEWVAVTVRTPDDAVRLLDGFTGVRLAEVRTGEELRSRLIRTVAAAAESLSRDPLIALARGLGAAADPAASLRDIRAIRSKEGLGLRQRIDHPYAPQEEICLPPWRFGGVGAGSLRRAPLLGEHTRSILGRLRDSAEVERLLGTDALVAAGVDRPAGVS